MSRDVDLRIPPPPRRCFTVFPCTSCKAEIWIPNSLFSYIVRDDGEGNGWTKCDNCGAVVDVPAEHLAAQAATGNRRVQGEAAGPRSPVRS